MEINKNELYSALNADPALLTNMARQIASSLGFPPESADALVQNRAFLVAKLSHMSDADISNMISMIGEDNAKMILNALKENGNG